MIRERPFGRVAFPGKQIRHDGPALVLPHPHFDASSDQKVLDFLDEANQRLLNRNTSHQEVGRTIWEICGVLHLRRRGMEREAWLAQVTEEVIEPELPICDPHHHLWDYPEGRYLLDELLADVGSGHKVVSTVFMECGSMYRADGPEACKPVGETEFVNGIAAMSASGQYGDCRACAAIVGYADLNLGRAVGDVLDRHAAVSSRFRGIRHAAGWDVHDEIRNSHTAPVEGMLGTAKFREGFAELGKRGMTFDGWLYHPQIGELTDLARAFPDQVIIFDHFGGPLGIGPYAGKRAEVFDYWKIAVRELARSENDVAKLGGLVMAINGFGFHKRERPAT